MSFIAIISSNYYLLRGVVETHTMRQQTKALIVICNVFAMVNTGGHDGFPARPAGLRRE